MIGVKSYVGCQCRATASLDPRATTLKHQASGASSTAKRQRTRRPPELPQGDSRFHPYQKHKLGLEFLGCRVCVRDKCGWQATWNTHILLWQGHSCTRTNCVNTSNKRGKTILRLLGKNIMNKETSTSPGIAYGVLCDTTLGNGLRNRSASIIIYILKTPERERRITSGIEVSYAYDP